MNGKKIVWITVGVVVVVASFLSGMAVGGQGQGFGLTGGDFASGYAAGMNEARKKISDSGIIPPTPAEIKVIAGTIKSVNSDRLVMSVSGRITPNPLDPQGPSERTVTMNEKTQVFQQVPMTASEQAAAMKAYQEVLRSGKTSAPPTPFKEVALDRSALKIGMIVTVTSDADVKTASTINAVKITFSTSPSSDSDEKK